MGHYDEYDQTLARSQSDRIERASLTAIASTTTPDKSKRNSVAITQGSGQQRVQMQQSRPSLPDKNRSEVSMQVPPNKDIPPRKQTAQVTISELQEELNNAYMQLDEYVAKFASMHSNDPYRVGDDRIAKDRDGLVADVRQWSRNFNRSSRGVFREISDKIVGNEPENPFERVTSEYARYLSGHSRGTSLLVQGYVWMQLVAEVFHETSFVWAGGPCFAKQRKGIEFCELHKSLNHLDQISYRKYSRISADLC